MQIDRKGLRALDISSAADSIIFGHYDRLPRLIIDRCLEGAREKFVSEVAAASEGGWSPVSETITMPRRGFGPRPVTIIDPVTRVVICALTSVLESDVPSSRTPENWRKFQGIVDEASKTNASGGTEAGSSDSWYLVSMDIASCYEYIDHERLRSEIVARSGNVPVARDIALLLDEISPGRGIPQLFGPSDLLADAYLAVMERELGRKESRIVRYADDFRLVSESWASANELIEVGAEVARRLGLVLSTEKTRISRFDTHRRSEASLVELLERRFSESASEMEDKLRFNGPYGTSDDEVGSLPEEGVFYSILSDWISGGREGGEHSVLGQFVPYSLARLESSADWIPTPWLEEIVFRSPDRLSLVVQYVLGREGAKADGSGWSVIASLTRMARQSPWAKLWLLHAIDSLDPVDPGDADFEVCSIWVMGQLTDRHEVVRAESAWVAAGLKRVDERGLERVYRSGSRLGRLAVAAACGRREVSSDSGLVKAIQGDARLAKMVFEWGEGR